VLSSVLIAGRVEDGCGGEERDIVRAGARPYTGQLETGEGSAPEPPDFDGDGTLARREGGRR
jgi:hypothetical protein